GANLDDIITKVKNSTSAYYELAFYPEQKNDPLSRIILKCKREGVELISIGYSEKGKPYRQMNAIEKKLFALNIINGGAWSRMAAKVGRIKFAKTKNKDHAPGETIEISIPPVMCNRQLDEFTIYLDPATQKASLNYEQIKMTEKALIDAIPKEKQQLYFVLIDPVTSCCVYNQVF
ncbi:MAG TPA: hypothetical protein VK186_11735, partial [Candidatus Deferrimicrobium sp.]|nr:hypothetical protein [Candidatus Deferrimicrobium sp.]